MTDKQSYCNCTNCEVITSNVTSFSLYQWYKHKVEKLGSCLMKIPQNDIIAFDAIERCKREKDKVLKGEIVWGIGPRTVKYIVDKYALHKYVKNWHFSNCCSNKHFECIINNNFSEKGKYFNKVKDKPL